MDELDCNSWGNNTLFAADDQWRIRAATATYHAARLINRDWVGPPGEPHALFAVSIEGAQRFGLERVSAFALRLPDGSWSLLILNKDPILNYSLAVDFRSGAQRMAARGPVRVTEFSKAQYQWKSARERGQPTVNRGPESRTEPGLPIELPAYSITVIRLGAPERG
jgi:hypothetical protein